MEKEMRCPFRKEVRYTVHPTGEIYTHMEEEYPYCYKEWCMAYIEGKCSRLA